MSLTTDELLDRFFAAIERGDIDAIDPLYAEDVEVWHNVTRATMTKSQSLDLLRFWSGKVDAMRYEIVDRRIYPGGAVQRHVIHGVAGGTELEAPICIVFNIADDRITHVFEYLDPAAVAAVFP